jgi:hypothetical protein
MTNFQVIRPACTKNLHLIGPLSNDLFFIPTIISSPNPCESSFKESDVIKLMPNWMKGGK